jgi:FkbM family methyltransferase
MADIDLRKFKAIHAAEVAVVGFSDVVFSDAGGDGWHLARIEDRNFSGCRLHLTLVCRIKGDAASAIHINHTGGAVVCVVRQDGAVIENAMAESVSVSIGPNGWLTIDATYPSGTPVFALGLSRTSPVKHHYVGDGSLSCEIKSLDIEPLAFRAVDNRVVFVDVGARFGLPANWVHVGDNVLPIMFEPEPYGAAELRQYVENFPGGKVIEEGLYNQTGSRQLYLTFSPGCASLLPPNPRYTRHYRTPQVFDVVRIEAIHVTSYLDLFKAGKVPQPDVIKIDVQGCEYEVLEGFGDLLSECFAIELETHISPLYHGQKLVTDIVALLDRFDFALLDLTKIGDFDRPLEFDARFVRPAEWWAKQPESVQEKGRTLGLAWGLR